MPLKFVKLDYKVVSFAKVFNCLARNPAKVVLYNDFWVVLNCFKSSFCKYRQNAEVSVFICFLVISSAYLHFVISMNIYAIAF